MTLNLANPFKNTGEGVSRAVACLSICLLGCQLVGHGCSDCDKTFSGGKKWANEHGGPFSISQKGKVKKSNRLALVTNIMERFEARVLIL